METGRRRVVRPIFLAAFIVTATAWVPVVVWRDGWHRFDQHLDLAITVWIVYSVIASIVWFLIREVANAITFIAGQRQIAAHGRRLAGLCPRCGYDLRATRDRCPECGWSDPADASS